MHIGGYFIDNPIALAPMAGITDKPFRRLCRAFGAGWAVCEMLASDPTLRNTGKTLHRSDFADEGGIVAVQIAGSDPEQMADAARYNVGLGAQVIDINMGCPAKKVCNVQAGSALMQDEPLVAAILEAVVKAAGVPVTLKTCPPSPKSPKIAALPPLPSTGARARKCTKARRVTNSSPRPKAV